jgi:hypothetical protein
MNGDERDHAPVKRRRAGVLVAVGLCTIGGLGAGFVVGRATAPPADTNMIALPEPVSVDERETDVVVFLHPRSAPEAIDQVTARVKGDPGIRASCFFSSELAHREFNVLFAENPDMVQQVSRDDLPASFRLDVAGDSRHAERIREEYQRLPEVREVIVGQRRQLKALRHDPRVRELFADSLPEVEGWECQGNGTMVVG